MDELATRQKYYSLFHSSQQQRGPVRLGVLGSTRGSSLQPVIDAIEAGTLDAKIEVVVSNLSKAVILQRARDHGLKAESRSAKGKERVDFDREVTKVLEDNGVELILLIGYMRILSDEFVKRWWSKCLNVHPSLLPDFAGGMDLAVHQAVIDAGRKESGCTVHLVTEVVDGGPIVVQKRCPVSPEDTAESLKAKVQPLEGTAFIEAVERYKAEGSFNSLM